MIMESRSSTETATSWKQMWSRRSRDYIDGKTEEIPFATRENIGRTVDFSAGRNRYIGYLISPADTFLQDHACRT